MADEKISAADREQLDEIGISDEELRRQIELFRRPPAPAQLVRPCTVNEDIVRIDPAEAPFLQALHAEAAGEGRFLKFVPASGAASRMFRDLIHFQRGPGRKLGWSDVVERTSHKDTRAEALVRFLRELDRFAFRSDLERVLSSQGRDLKQLAQRHRFPEILDGLLTPQGLDYENLPKALLKFHDYPEGSRTAFEEHLVEGAQHAADRSGRCRLHFTVSPDHRAGFDETFERCSADHGRRLEARFEVDYSIQKPSTDTVAVDLENRPLRDERGRLIFRPGGHGALIENLNDLRGDLIYVKNIDNILPDHHRATVVEWKRVLGGYLVKLQSEIHRRLRELRRSDGPAGAIEEAIRFTGSHLHVALNGRPAASSPRSRREALIRRLDRPLRVCGVVPNMGEPGGGPFRVRARDGSFGLQIVEGAQIDRESREQQEILRGATHFNPVDLVCAVRNEMGEPYDLTRFIDESTVIVTEKSSGGRAIKALERPGLWNGAMAAWNTVFVEVPLATFAPVKTVLDLLRDVHQPPR